MPIDISVPKEFLARRYSRYYIYIEPVVRDPLVRGYFSFVASLFLIAFLLVFALSPTINTILTLQKKITEQKRLVAALEQKIAALVTAQQNYSQIESDLPTLLAALPTTPMPQTVITAVAQSASAAGVPVSGLRFQDLPLSVEATAFSPVEFSLSTSGQSDKIRSFLEEMESAPRQIRLTALTISRSLEASGDLVNITATGYYLKEGGND